MVFSRYVRAGAIALAMLAAPVAAKAETLTSAFSFAYMNNPNIMSALLSVKSAAEDVALRKAGKYPTIGGSVDVSTGVSNFSFDPSLTSTLNLSYRQTLFDNFQTDAQIESARAFVELSMYALRNEEQNVLLSVVNAYVGVVRDTQLVQLRQDNVAFFDAQVSSAEERLRIGEGTRIDVSQATARRAQAIASYRAAVASLATSQASYERWVGHKPQNLSLDYAFGDLVPDSIDSAIALSSVRHPAILTALAAIRASQAGSDAARAAFGPTLDLIGSLCAVNCFGSSTTTGISASVRLTLSVPIYAGGALGASVRKANIEQIKSEVDALAARDQIREAVISAWSTLQNATAQIESAQSAVSAGDVVLEGLIQERDVGQRTTLDVLNAQAEVTSAREGLIQATSTRIIAAFSLIAATGRLSPVDLGLGVAPHQNEAALYAAKVEDTWQELTALD